MALSRFRSPRIGRLAPLLIAIALAAAGCGTAAGATIDLTDPDVLIRLDAAPPTDIDWKRTIDGVAVAGAGTVADPAELAVLEAGLAEIPDELRERAGLGTIYRASDGVAGDVEEPTLAFSRGRDIYLLDRTFVVDGRFITRFELARVLGHELAHVAQFSALTGDDLAGLLDGEAVPREVDPIAESALVADFAAAAGWRRAGTGWVLADPSGTTTYGATAPDEDLAEVVSLMLIGRASWASAARVAWVEEWFGVSAAVLAGGKPYLPPGSVPLDTSQPLYGEAEAARFGAVHTDAESFRLPVDGTSGEDLAASVAAELTGRGMAGTLDPVADDRVERYAGYFLRGDGVGLWVELWDFRRAPGFLDPPPYPVVTYVTLW